jgi:rod shape-determining protein MreC
MQTLFLFFFKYRAFALFLALQLLCAWLIIQNNRYQSAAFFNSANFVAASITEAANEVESYLFLKENNESLAQENALLRERLQELEQRTAIPYKRASVPTEVAQQYNFEAARVINNSTNRAKNFITLNKGRKDGIEPGMGVIGTDGVVGKIKSVSDHYSVAISLLHTNFYVSSVIKGLNAFGSMHWNGTDPKEANLEFIARHHTVNVGDTVVTSSFNAVFPYGIPVGIVTEVNLPDNSTYYDITVDLAADFSSLPFVYVIKNQLLDEKDSLEQASLSF